MARTAAISEGGFDEIARLTTEIPELNPADPSEYERRMASDGYCLVARIGGGLAGFKAGYDRYSDGTFYSWLGGVAPAYRRDGIAQALLDAQETWAAEQSYRGIYVKTRNRFVGMRILLARNGYDIVGVEADAERQVADTGLMHFKAL